jgi:hypothetical protein
MKVKLSKGWAIYFVISHLSGYVFSFCQSYFIIRTIKKLMNKTTLS